jgi:hypothetical protein
VSPPLAEAISQSNMEQHLPENIPQTIQDAITVTVELGERYLWADYFCVDQFDPELRNGTISHMNVVYA